MGIKKIQIQLKQLAYHIEADDKADKTVSHVSIYWHVEHCLKVLGGVTTMLEQSTPADFKPRWSIIKTYIMITGFIPRGKGRAPKQTIPNNLSDKTTLKAMHAKVFLQIQQLDNLPPTSCFKHPLFKWLDKKQTVRFMAIHTNHHLKIIKDITGK